MPVTVQTRITGLDDAVAMTAAVQRQLPFAAMRTINTTIDDVRKRLTAEITVKMPTARPFTERAVGAQSATKTDLKRGRVFLKDIQGKYLYHQVFGGVRTPETRHGDIHIPALIKINKYGNIPRGRIKTLKKSQKKYFYGRVGRTLGIWERIYGGDGKAGELTDLKLLVFFKKTARYKIRYPFHDLGIAEFDRVWRGNAERAFRHAMETAR